VSRPVRNPHRRLWTRYERLRDLSGAEEEASRLEARLRQVDAPTAMRQLGSPRSPADIRYLTALFNWDGPRRALEHLEALRDDS
jgi:hypothetical protein